MPLTPPPADYKALRTTLVRAILTATGLADGQVIFEQIEGMDAPRPNYPYVGILTIEAAGTTDPDFYLPVRDEPNSPTGLYTYYGRRTMTVSLSCYGESHRQAYHVGASIQAAMMQIPMRDMLRAGGLVVADIGSVEDSSELLNTGYEGRSQLDLTLGYICRMTVDMGRIDTIPITAEVIPLPSESYNVEELS